MNSGKPRILIYGYGNPGRQDDGMGVKLAETIEKWSIEHHIDYVRTDSNYQLNLEDAAEVAKYDMVIFADASEADKVTDFRFEPLKPSATVEFTMHAVAPAFVLHLCKQVFDHEPEAWLMHIRGYEWEFMQEMTENAGRNLDKACAYIKGFILKQCG